jgi:ribosomal protein S18 acetylase RimI-like enzyme
MIPFAFRREATDDPRARVWLLDDAGAVVGRCETAPAGHGDADLGPRAAQIHALLVASGHRGRGLGLRLLGQAVNDLLVRGHAPVFAWVPEDDAALLGFYDRHGFRADGAAHGGRVRVVRQR